MSCLKPIWKYKVRIIQTRSGVERLVKIPHEVAEAFGDYAIVTIENGKLVIEPLENFNFKNFKGGEQG